MPDINELFRARIGFPENEAIKFESLNKLLDKTAKTIPFENLAILKNDNKDITKEYLVEKILTNNEGGVCYEINTMLYYFLKEVGFDAKLVRGRTFIPATQKWSPTGRTHVIVLLSHNGESFVVDSGYGLNLALKPVPLTGEVVSSKTGEFRVRQIDDEQGDYLLEIKPIDRDNDWVSGYIFDSKHEVAETPDLNQIRQVIVESPHSPINKAPLLTKITDNGNIVLTNTSFTERICGKEVKHVINQQQFQELKKKHFHF